MFLPVCESSLLFYKITCYVFIRAFQMYLLVMCYVLCVLGWSILCKCMRHKFFLLYFDGSFFLHWQASNYVVWPWCIASCSCVYLLVYKCLLDKERRVEHVHRIVPANSCLQPHILSILCKLRGPDAVCNINFASCKRNCEFFLLILLLLSHLGV
jgi:hypothetical protein